jgi:TatA/E family protein of Tat protein translocase
VPGFVDLILILFVVLVVFAAGKLPQIATSIGRSIENLRGQGDPSKEKEKTKNADS